MTSPHIPTVEDLASDVLTHRFDDMFNPPGLTNFLGAAQVDHDVVAVRSVNFPPYSHGDTVTGSLYIDGRLFRSFGCEVEVVWRPDRVVRRAEVDELFIETVTACPPGTAGVVVDISITNRRDTVRVVSVALSVSSTVTRSGGPWLASTPPGESNTLERVTGRDAILGRAGSSAAVSVQGWAAAGAPNTTSGSVDAQAPRMLRSSLRLAPGETRRVGYIHTVGGTEDEALAAFDRLAEDVPAVISAAEAEWNRQLTAAFTPGSGEFTGSMPILETSSDELRRLYWWGVLGVIWFRRDNPASVMGRTYDTLMPRYWQTTTFIWDYSLSSLVHALLDPVPMRRHLEHWVTTDIHTHFGTEWQAGAPVGNWYSVNDYAMIRLVRDYVRFTGDLPFLDWSLAAAGEPPRPVSEHVLHWSQAWKSLRRGSALADYGEIDNLLECVSTYVHEVASLNGANVWCMRVAADMADLRGDDEIGKRLREEADELAQQVNELYVQGEGFFHARHPDGSLVPVRHCYDFSTVGLTMPGDLTAEQRSEMVQFFQRELQTPSWMRALSPFDADATYSVRPDHQWNGAYPAWPADAARALAALGAGDVMLSWLPGLSRTANQGPCGQAHFVEEAEPAVNGGAVKSPPQFPYLIDWACSSAGSWAALIIESVFGVSVSLDGVVTAEPLVGELDPGARLTGLVVGGVAYDVAADGTVTRTSN
ncbi:hypothetical protein G1H11_08840 [Phytoactinopolyspora alkaliphila]|uniref:Alpha-L-rhamnosidase six-hairpin glycosidase domain-containing protein n=1 Tax=Phytoactinopolyspora alkaliphila TaxID=1783498 RepID=A0A6N9YKI5_9ACTN|nr:hypothetical protein [Phytoactinopolyspora alkaliphila]NED95420.1 hypothetical protein [Phytoactinopolyspora alkaliphila]